ncbi:DUF1365 domain-containing protein [Hydrogenophaga sp. ANAO-22]|jgi:DUF1365 family protein|uniref:DUF1365 domain-containing protein n=1 Tax=Hydrogenophaga sp. ANAO-22 TaxID=3166645 RepID=UPI0036D3B0B9
MNAAVAQLGFGQVRHTRHRPRHHAFAYATCFLMLPMRSLRAHGPGALARNRSAALSFHDTDHGDGRADSLGWLDEVLHQHGIHDAQGEVWLHTYPRMLGYSFKPVSFWYCHRPDGSLRAVLAEVNNTFGERHCYLLDAPRYGQPCEAAKVFHVSPFCPVRGRYRFVFMRTQGPTARTVARIDYFDGAGEAALLNTSVSGELLPLDARTLRRALWSHPAMTLGVIARIHWQALRLWWQKAPFFRQPPAPGDFVTAAVPSAPTVTAEPRQP